MESNGVESKWISTAVVEAKLAIEIEKIEVTKLTEVNEA